jgi:hypothetical protein
VFLRWFCDVFPLFQVVLDRFNLSISANVDDYRGSAMNYHSLPIMIPILAAGYLLAIYLVLFLMGRSRA